MNGDATEAAEIGFASPRRLPFVIGAAADLLLGLDLLAAGEFMASWLAPGVESAGGIPAPTLFHAVGGLLLAVGAATLAFARLDAGRRTLWTIVVLNEAWISAGVALVAFAQDAFPTVGNVAVLGFASVLAGLAFFQFRYLRGARA